MILAERVGTRQRALNEMDGRDGLFVGMAQALALIPGVSRSGATISAGLFRNFDRVAAARYSFLLSVPAVVLSGLFELRKVGENGSPSAGATVIATLVAFVTGYAAIAWLLRYLGTHTLGIFVVYRIALGVAVLTLAATGAIS
jgi:undecaprenyl-diphosphatase